jgi:hypothetical protein
MPVMAYSPLGGPGASLVRDPTLARIGASHGCSAAAELAQTATSPEKHALYVKMASVWFQMAQRWEKKD